MIGWIVAAYLGGALLVVLATDRRNWHADDVFALMVWPLLLPFAFFARRWRKWRYTCRDCGRFYGDRVHLDLHLRERTGCTIGRGTMNQQVEGGSDE